MWSRCTRFLAAAALALAGLGAETFVSPPAAEANPLLLRLLVSRGALKPRRAVTGRTAQSGAPRGAGERSHVKTLSGIDPDAILGFLETALAFGRFFGSGGSSLFGAPARAGDRERAEIIANIDASLASLDGLVAVRPCGTLLAAGHGDGSITLAYCATETISADKIEQKRLLRDARSLLSHGAPAVAGHLCEDGSALYAEAYWDRNILERPCDGRPAWEANIVLIP